MEKQYISDLMRGHNDTMILKLLLSGDKYGYQIGKMILELSEGAYELKEATMYSSFKRLEESGAIECYWGDSFTGGRRKYYRVTDEGKKTYEVNKEIWLLTKKLLDILV